MKPSRKVQKTIQQFSGILKTKIGFGRFKEVETFRCGITIKQSNNIQYIYSMDTS